MGTIHEYIQDRRAGLALLALAGALYGCGAGPAQAARPQSSPEAETLTVAELEKTALGQLEPSAWADPPMLPLKAGADGALEGTLRVAYANHKLKMGKETKQLNLRSYNGGLIGPTIVVKAGDTLRIKLENNLPAEAHPCKEMVMKGECAWPKHGFNMTNLHTHGLHVSPKSPSDDVLRMICPGAEYKYTFQILPAGNPGSGPAKHYPGTFWYHAHNHGSTAMQLASGMAGALIVRGDIDEVPEIKAARERIFVFQQLAFNSEGKVEDFNEIKNEWKSGKRHTIINGKVKPLIRMRPGEVERWRLIDSGIFEDLPIRISEKDGAGFKMHRIAIDGITRPQSEEIQEIELGPGYRVDLLVQAPLQQGDYYLYKKQSKYSLSGENPPPGVNGPEILAQLQVRGEKCVSPCANKIPTKLPAPTAMLPDIAESEVTKKRLPIKFTVEDAEDELFAIDEKCFDRDVPIFQDDLPKVGDVEEWTIVNETGQAHPFHIHVNAFQVLSKEGKPVEWRDTILVPPYNPNKPGTNVVRFRTRFERFDGDFVLHCHILTHEDSGMMSLVRVKPKVP